ncbi:MAG TPA: hypothetical protein VNO55_32175 [Polyangia bacterium]|nr:hypothetical protein [Polyangia bacterium]
MTAPFPKLIAGAAAVIVCLTVASAAWAATSVVVLRPPQQDPFIDEIFHRVGGELRVHGFSVQQQDAQTEDDLPLGEARDLLARTHADACVAFLSRGETSVVRVWVAGQDGAPSLFEAVSLRRTPDVPTILAARAVDLLTSALGQPTQPSPPPPPATTPPPDTLVAPGDERPTAPPRWALAIGSVAAMRNAGFGSSLGPQLTLESVLTPRWSWSARLVGPLWGPRHTNDDATVSLTEGAALAQAVATLISWPWLAARARFGVGGVWLHAAGSVDPAVSSLLGNTQTRLTAVAALGVELIIPLAARVSVGLGGDLFAMWPRPVVDVGHQTVRIAQPQPSAALDLRFGF